MIETAVLDSTCLIVLERVGHLDLIRQVFHSILVPPAVQREFGEGPA